MIGALLGLWLGAEVTDAFVLRRFARRRGYQRALRRSRELGVPLLVVGRPQAGFINDKIGPDYGCGDVCIDAVGCSPCPRHVEGRLEDVLPRVPSASHVIFVSCTLEYVDDLPLCIRELERVAVPGGLFVARVAPGSSTFWLWPGAKWVLHSIPPGPWRYARRKAA